MCGIGLPETVVLYLFVINEKVITPLTLFSSRILRIPRDFYKSGSILLLLIISIWRTLSSKCKHQNKRFNRLYISCHCADTFMSIFQHLELFDSWLLAHCWCLELRSAGGAQPSCWTLGCKYLTLYVCLPLRHVQTLLTVLCWPASSDCWHSQPGL